MIRRIVYVKNVLDLIDPRILSEYGSNLENRILAQKIIYLIQEKGYDLGFRFCWYSRGPHSSELADCIGEELFV